MANEDGTPLHCCRLPSVVDVVVPFLVFVGGGPNIFFIFFFFLSIGRRTENCTASCNSLLVHRHRCFVFLCWRGVEGWWQYADQHGRESWMPKLKQKSPLSFLLLFASSPFLFRRWSGGIYLIEKTNLNVQLSPVSFRLDCRQPQMPTKWLDIQMEEEDQDRLHHHLDVLNAAPVVFLWWPC